MKCPECRGSGVFDRIGWDLLDCPACDGTGAAELRCVCGRFAKTLYPLDSWAGDPSCGRPACELRMQAATDYHDEAGSR